MQFTHRAACLGALLVIGWATSRAHAAITLAQEPTEQTIAPVEVVPTPDDHTRIVAGLGGRAEAMWLEGEVLWLVKDNPDGPWSTIGGVSVPLKQVDGTDLWAIGLRWDRWAEAFMGVAFLNNKPPAGPIVYQTWRGERAPSPPEQAPPGRIESFELPGPVQGSKRTITVVLPPGYKGQEHLPAIVLADGQSAEEWGGVVAAMVIKEKAQPVAVVGVHSGGYAGDRSQPYDPELDVRAREYLEGFDKERFDDHLNWVIESVLPEVSRRYAISLQRENLGVAGFSNGGAFAATAALRRGDVFGMALAMSVGVPPDLEPRVQGVPMARFYFAAGELEHQFLDHTTITFDSVKAAGGDARLVSFVAGHDPEMWRLALARYLPEMFPPVQRDALRRESD